MQPIQYFIFDAKTSVLKRYNLSNNLVVLFVLLSSLACQNKKQAETKVIPVKRDSTVAKSSPYTLDMVVNQKDLACYMPLKEGIGDTVHYHGKVYGFCSKECKKEFRSRPSYYVKD